jgi:hypothetical protein
LPNSFGQSGKAFFHEFHAAVGRIGAARTEPIVGGHGDAHDFMRFPRFLLNED